MLGQLFVDPLNMIAQRFHRLFGLLFVSQQLLSDGRDFLNQAVKSFPACRGIACSVQQWANGDPLALFECHHGRMCQLELHARIPMGGRRFPPCKHSTTSTVSTVSRLSRGGIRRYMFGIRHFFLAQSQAYAFGNGRLVYTR